MKYNYIYKITCLCGSLAGHYYIGKHSTDAIPENCGYAGSGKILKDYYSKYGKELGKTYSIEILEKNADNKINALREEFFIGDLYETDPLCLNLKKGGDGGGAKGVQRSEETRRKISESLKGNPKLVHKGKEHPMYGKHFVVSEETRLKISNALTGIKRTEEECEKIRQRMKGTTVHQATRDKIRNTLKGNICWNKMVGAECRYIRQIDKNGHTVKIWDLQKDCFYGYQLSHIKQCCENKRKTHKKYCWEWAPIRVKKIRIAV